MRSVMDQKVGITNDPIGQAVHLREPVRHGIEERFSATDPSPGLDIARNRFVAKLLHNRKFQFLLILPNQIIFWTVIFVGLLGTTIPGLNFGAAITWYVWFCLVFVMMVVVGRAWCAMCPFGGFGEWIQRRTLFKRTQKALGLGRKFPESLAQFGFLIPVASFLLLTWIEEFFNIAAPGNPADTSWMVVGIVGSALAFFLVFERRTFCRYICPLTTLIATVGSMGSVTGFRTRDREVCISCETKDCMRGGEEGFGCPWYTWPGSADSNLSCGLCTECYKACPSDNVGLFLQRPLTSVVAPRNRRIDVAWGIVALWGLVIYQQLNATRAFASLDTSLNTFLRFPHYPDPIGYLGVIAGATALTAGGAGLVGLMSGTTSKILSTPGRFFDRTSRFRSFFVPMAYGLIPIVGADYFARQLPKFFQSSPRVIPAAGHVFGLSSMTSPLYNFSLMTNGWIVVTQVAVVVLGTIAALWSTAKIVDRELVPISGDARLVRVSALIFTLSCGVLAAVLYVLMHAAD